ncbi:hypothetical protein [Embleya sp. NPDC059259]|uniref:hypothetical protein n=1 Tax=unclassified Embleya TaxID=2699296 RepID=UPI0036773D73
MTHPPELVRAQIAHIAHHLHWSLGDLLDTTHEERAMWVREIGLLHSFAGPCGGA